jgi:hypothetical protein
VALEMGPQLARPMGEKGGHRLQVGLEGIDIQE